MKKPTPVVWGTTAVHTIQCQVGVQSATVAQQPIPIGKSEEIVAVRHRVVLQFVAIAAAAEVPEVAEVVHAEVLVSLLAGLILLAAKRIIVQLPLIPMDAECNAVIRM